MTALDLEAIRRRVEAWDSPNVTVIEPSSWIAVDRRALLAEVERLRKIESWARGVLLSLDEEAGSHDLDECNRGGLDGCDTCCLRAALGGAR